MKIKLFIILLIIAFSSCSRDNEEKEENEIKTFGLVNNINKNDSVNDKLIIHDWSQEVYNSLDNKYKTYIEKKNRNYKNYNKNGKHLIFPFHNGQEIIDDQHISIFKYYNDIFIISYDYNITDDYYIDINNMYYFTSLENTKSKELFEKTPVEYRCKISVKDNKIQFYDENCEKRIKDMLNIS